jgi:hypothetical protein
MPQVRLRALSIKFLSYWVLQWSFAVRLDDGVKIVFGSLIFKQKKLLSEPRIELD